MTKFAAMTNEEFKDIALIKYKKTEGGEVYQPKENVALPTSVNWTA